MRTLSFLTVLVTLLSVAQVQLEKVESDPNVSNRVWISNHNQSGDPAKPILYFAEPAKIIQTAEDSVKIQGDFDDRINEWYKKSSPLVFWKVPATVPQIDFRGTRFSAGQNVLFEAYPSSRPGRMYKGRIAEIFADGHVRMEMYFSYTEKYEHCGIVHLSTREFSPVPKQSVAKESETK